ncbi:acetyltransferase [Colletotrichum navitas]|uniref:Acetyltransferase n=1 Tax=Colletotrichum navitas TaxID=681940 RepID=A0AAD8VCA9_9PEZI|nr:acetyltransferase [Colletotrichum navitas]KAK1599345.1 acetyltransferase [Colletotrichum navitas]
MPLNLRFATPADGPALVAIYLSAFHDSPVATNCFPSSSQACRQFLTASFIEEMGNPRFQWLVITDSDFKDDPDLPIACAKWVYPAKNGGHNVEPMPPKETWPKEGNPEFADYFFRTLGRKHAEIMGEVRHYYLELIICRREHQGKGAATPLMKWGCSRADEEGKLVFLEAVAAAKPIYEKYGFHTVDREDMTAPDGAVVQQFFMLREGKAADEFKSTMDKLGKSD